MEYKGKLYAVSHDSALLFNSTPETKLELAKNCSTEYDVNADIGELLTNEKVLLYEAPIMFW